SKLIDKAKRMEAKYKEERAERERRMKSKGQGQSSHSRGHGTSSSSRNIERQDFSCSQSQNRGGQGTGQPQNVPMLMPPPASQVTVKTGQLPQTRTSCNVCGKPHRGECRYRSGVCYYCGQPGHMARDCPRLGTPSTMTPVSQTSVQI